MKRIFTTVLMLLGMVAMYAYPVKITSWHIKDDVKRLNALHLSVDYVNQATQTILVDVQNDSKYQLLLSNGFQTEILPDPALESRDPQRNYLSWTDFVTFMQSMPTQYPNICQLVQYGTTTQNRPMYFLKISDNVTTEENEPEFRYFSSIHGNEVVGYDMCIRLIQLLTSQYGTNTRITNIVNNTEFWVCPMTNPDGYAMHQRTNANGVDLNRNFPTPLGNQHPDGEAWQVETQAIMNHSQAHSFNLSGMFHGGELVVNYLWDYTTTVCADNNLVIQGALAYADHNPDLHNSTDFPNGITEGAEWYAIDGSLQDWMYGYTDEINYTLEIGDYWPDQSLLDGYWADNEESMLSLLEFIQRGVTGTVTDTGGSPLDASITVTNNIKVMHNDPDVGDYHRLLLPGTYTITAGAAGFISQSAQVTVPAAGTVTHNFVLASASTLDFTGTVINNSGIPIAGATVRLLGDETEEQSTTDVQGHFIMPDTFSGNYTLNVMAAGYGTNNQAFTLSAETNHQVIVMTPPFFTEIFESGAGNWTLSGTWAIITQGMGHVLTDSPGGNYADNLNMNAALTNPVSLQNISNPALTFETKYALESGYDYLKVQGSLNGTNWTTLAEYTGTQSSWVTIALPLTAYANQSFRLRFRLETDNTQTADGVYIDNIAISGSNSTILAYGDIDDNNLINLSDAAFTLEYAVGNNPLPEIDPRPWETNRLETADVDNDSSITPVDAYIIANKTLDYTGVFPAQGGAAYSFTNPGVVLQYLDGSIRLRADNPENLASAQLQFTAANALSIGELNWLFSGNQCLTALNSASNTLALLNTGVSTLNPNLADINVSTTSLLVHCNGFVNGLPFSQDISLVGNEDNNGAILRDQLHGCYPNPFNPETTIRFSIKKNHTPVQIDVYNARGQLTRNLLQTDLNNGVYNEVFNGKDNSGNSLGNGIYFIRMHTPDKVSTHKMVILK